MGTLANYAKIVGVLAAVLFIITAFVMLLIKGSKEGVLDDMAQILLTITGVFAFIAGLLMATKSESGPQKTVGAFIMLTGLVVALAYVLIKFVDVDSVLLLEIIGIMAIITMLVGCIMHKKEENMNMVYVDILFMIVVAVMIVMLFMENIIGIAQAAIVIAIGFWLVAHVFMAVGGAAEEDAIDPNRKSAKRAQKQKSKHDAQERKEQERQAKLQSKKKADKAKHREEAKHESKKSEAAKPAAESKPEPEPAKEEPKVEETVAEEPVAEAVVAEAEVIAEEPKAEPAPVEEPKVEEPEPVKEEPKEQIKAAPAEPKAEEPKAEPEKPKKDFMSRLVSSKDASSKVAPAAKEEPKEEPKAEEPAPVEEPKEESKEEPKEEPAAEPEPVKEEPVAEPEPVKEEPKAEEPAPVEAVATAAAAAAVAEPEPEEDEPASDDEDEGELEDIYTDYSPEALVRRAAWNKGMRCRRDYGEYHIPVAFVKGKVAVYVEEPGSEDREVEAKLKEDGWVVLRYDISKITDGLAEGAEIAEAVKANTRAQKAAKKKKKPAKK